MYRRTTSGGSGGEGVTDHGALTGLTDDDHPYVLKSVLDANTVLYATTDDTPAALAVAASRVVGRKASGDVAAMTAAEVMTLLRLGSGWLLWHNANQSIGAGATVTLAWNQEEEDDAAFHDTVTNNERVTVPSGYAGLYLVVVQLLWANATPTNGVGFSLRKNGTTVIRQTIGTQNAGSNSNQAPGVYRVRLAEADYLEVRAFNNQAGAHNIVTSQAACIWQGTLVGV